MRSITLSRSWMLLLSGVLIYAPLAPASDPDASGKPASTGYYIFCTASQNPQELPEESTSPPAQYFTGAFFLPDASTLPQVNNGFMEYLKEKYSFETDPLLALPVSCTIVKTLADAQSALEARLTSGRKTDPNAVVETGWTFGGK